MALGRRETFSPAEVKSTVEQWVDGAFGDISKGFRDQIVRGYTLLALDVIDDPAKINDPGLFASTKMGTTEFVPGWKESWTRANRKDLIEILELCGMDPSNFAKEAVRKSELQVVDQPANLTLSNVSGLVKETIRERGLDMSQVQEIIGLWIEIAFEKGIISSNREAVTKNYLDLVRQIDRNPNFIKDKSAYPYRYELVEIMGFCGRDISGYVRSPSVQGKIEEKKSNTIEDVADEVFGHMTRRGIARTQVLDVVRLWFEVSLEGAEGEMRAALIGDYFNMVSEILRNPYFINDKSAYPYREDLIEIAKLCGKDVRNYVRQPKAIDGGGVKKSYKIEDVSQKTLEEMARLGVDKLQRAKVVGLWVRVALEGIPTPHVMVVAMENSYIKLLQKIQRNPDFINHPSAYPHREDLVAIAGLWGEDLRGYIKEKGVDAPSSKRVPCTAQDVAREVCAEMEKLPGLNTQEVVTLWMQMAFMDMNVNEEMKAGVIQAYSELVWDISLRPEILDNPDLCDETDLLGGVSFIKGWKKAWVRAHRDDLKELVKLCAPKPKPVVAPVKPLAPVPKVMDLPVGIVVEDVPRRRGGMIGGVAMVVAAAALAGWLTYKNFFEKPQSVMNLARQEQKQPKRPGVADESVADESVLIVRRSAEMESRQDKRGIDRNGEKVAKGKKGKGKKEKEEDEKVAAKTEKNKDPVKDDYTHDAPIPEEKPAKEKKEKSDDIAGGGGDPDVIESSKHDSGIRIDPDRPMLEQYEENMPKLVAALQFRIDQAIRGLDFKDTNDWRMVNLLDAFDVERYFESTLVIYRDHPEILRKILEAEMPTISIKPLNDPGLKGLAFKGHNVIVLAYSIFSKGEMQRVFSHELEHILVQTSYLRSKVIAEGVTELHARDVGGDLMGFQAYEKLVFRSYVLDLLDTKFLKHFYAFDRGGDVKELLNEVFEGDEDDFQEKVEGFLDGKTPMSDIWEEITGKMVAKMLEQGSVESVSRSKLSLILLALSAKNGLITFNRAQALYKIYVSKYEIYISRRTVAAFKDQNWKYFNFYDQPLTEEEEGAMEAFEDIEIHGDPNDSGVIDKDGSKEPKEPVDPAEPRDPESETWRWIDTHTPAADFPERRPPELEEEGRPRRVREVHDEKIVIKQGHDKVSGNDFLWEDIRDWVSETAREAKQIMKELYRDGIIPVQDFFVEAIDFSVKNFKEVGTAGLLALYIFLLLLRDRKARQLAKSKEPIPRGGVLNRKSAFLENFMSEVAMQPGNRLVKQAIYARARGEIPSLRADGTQLTGQSPLDAATQDLAEVFWGSTSKAIKALDALEFSHRTELAHPAQEYRYETPSATKPRAIAVIEERFTNIGCEGLKGKKKRKKIEMRRAQISDGDIVITGFNHKHLSEHSTTINCEYFNTSSGTFHRYDLPLKEGEAVEILFDMRCYSETSRDPRFKLKSKELDECKLDFEMEKGEEYRGHMLLPNGMYCVRTMNWSTGAMIHSPTHKLVPTPFYKGVIPREYFNTARYGVGEINFETGEFVFRNIKTGETVKIQDFGASVRDMNFQQSFLAGEFKDSDKDSSGKLVDNHEHFEYRERLLYGLMFGANEKEVVVGEDGFTRYIPKAMNWYLKEMPQYVPFKGPIGCRQFGGVSHFYNTAGEQWYGLSKAKHLSGHLRRSQWDVKKFKLEGAFVADERGTLMCKLDFTEEKGRKHVDEFDLFEFPASSFEEVFKRVVPGAAQYGFEEEVQPEDLKEGLIGDLYKHHEVGSGVDKPPVLGEKARKMDFSNAVAIISRIKLNKALLDRDKIKKDCSLKWEKGRGIGIRAVVKDWNEMPEYMGSRRYGQGDDFRAIDWKLTARSTESVTIANGHKVELVDHQQTVGKEMDVEIAPEVLSGEEFEIDGTAEKTHPDHVPVAELGQDFDISKMVLPAGDVYVKVFDYEAAKQVYSVVLAVESLSLENYAKELYEVLFALAIRKNRMTRVQLVLTNHEVNFRKTIALSDLNIRTVDQVFDRVCEQAQVFLSADRNSRKASLRDVSTSRFQRALNPGDPNFVRNHTVSRIEALSGKAFEEQRGRIPGLKEGYHMAIGFPEYGKKEIEINDHQKRKAGARPRAYKRKVA